MWSMCRQHCSYCWSHCCWHCGDHPHHCSGDNNYCDLHLVGDLTIQLITIAHHTLGIPLIMIAVIIIYYYINFKGVDVLKSPSRNKLCELVYLPKACCNILISPDIHNQLQYISFCNPQERRCGEME